MPSNDSHSPSFLPSPTFPSILSFRTSCTLLHASLSKPLIDVSQYFLMPYRFLQECRNSAGFHWNGTGISLESSRIQWNSSIPAGMALEFRFFQPLQSHILRYMYTGYTSFFLATIWSLFASLYSFLLLSSLYIMLIF